MSARWCHRRSMMGRRGSARLRSAQGCGISGEMRSHIGTRGVRRCGMSGARCGLGCHRRRLVRGDGRGSVVPSRPSCVVGCSGCRLLGRWSDARIAHWRDGRMVGWSNCRVDARCTQSDLRPAGPPCVPRKTWDSTPPQMSCDSESRLSAPATRRFAIPTPAPALFTWILPGWLPDFVSYFLCRASCFACSCCIRFDILFIFLFFFYISFLVYLFIST